MVIYCDSGGNVKSVPSMVTFGETLTDITIVTPQQSSAVLLKVEPPTGEYMPHMICAPIINQDGILIYNVKIYKGVTVASGRCYYQLEFIGGGEHIDYDENGDPIVAEGVVKWQSEKGSFNILRGTNIDLPLSKDILKDYALDELYSLLASITQAQQRITAAEEKIGVDKELEGAEKNVIDAINAISRKQGISTDKSLTADGVPADAKAVGERLLEKINYSDIVDNLNTDNASKPLSSSQGFELDKRLRAIENAPFAEKVGF